MDTTELTLADRAKGYKQVRGTDGAPIKIKAKYQVTRLTAGQPLKPTYYGFELLAGGNLIAGEVAGEIARAEIKKLASAGASWSAWADGETDHLMIWLKRI